MDAGNVIDPRVVNALNGVATAGQRSTTDQLRDNFMTLLVAQLKNQDPMNPLENAELTSQLAQINTVSGIDRLNSTLNGINSQIETGQNLQAASLIGKGILVPGDRLLAGEDGVTTPFGVELEASAHKLEAHIVNGAGEIVSTLSLSNVKAGVETFVWDGKLANGEVAPQGSYRVLVEASTKDGKPVTANALNYAVVSGISTDPVNGLRLDLGGVAEQVRLEDIRQIY